MAPTREALLALADDLERHRALIDAAARDLAVMGA
jgi:hypothetical protein